METIFVFGKYLNTLHIDFSTILWPYNLITFNLKALDLETILEILL